MCSGSPRHQSFDGSAKMALKLYLIRLSADVRNEIVLVVTSSLSLEFSLSLSFLRQISL